MLIIPSASKITSKPLNAAINLFLRLIARFPQQD
jgi:hypothetical protein